MISRLSVLALILLCTACSSPTGINEEQLRAKSKAWEEAFNANDAKSLSAVYASDGMLLPPNAEFIQGRDSIANYWAEFIATVNGKLMIQEVSVENDLAYILGTFELIDDDGDIADKGKYIEIWKKKDNRWELYRDIWNTNLPLPDTSG